MEMNGRDDEAVDPGLDLDLDLDLDGDDEDIRAGDHAPSRSVGPPVQPGRFFLPGPTEVHAHVLASQAQPMIGHRGPAIQDLMAGIQHGIRAIMGTERPVFIATASATGFMEAGVRNVPRGRVLSLVNGAFSERFAALAESCGHEVDRMEVSWGSAHDPDQVADALEGTAYEAVTVAHSETSTGALNDIYALGAAVRAHGGPVLLVDSVTGVGGTEIRSDRWGLDWVLTGSQKALALPPGLAFGVASAAMMERSAAAKDKGHYFDLEMYARNLQSMQTPTTPAVTLLYALAAQLRRIEDETLHGRWKRHRTMARRTWEWVDDLRDGGLDVEVLAPAGSRSPTVTAMRLPPGTSGPSVVAALRKRGWVIGGGYGKLEDTTVRIGHMGDHTPEELEPLLEVLADVLADAPA